MTVIDLLQFPMTFFPTIVALMAESRVSLNRIEKFLLAEEVVEKATFDDEDTPIRIIDGNSYLIFFIININRIFYVDK